MLTVARIAGIQASKRTGELIPLCHPLGLDHADVEFTWAERPADDSSRDAGAGSASPRAVLVIRAEASLAARTGVEMEALTAATIAALTVYDMCKAVDKAMVIEAVRLLEKEKRE